MKGLFNKFMITRTDGKPVNPEAEYFVLRLDNKQSHLEHLQASLKALNAYANAIAESNPVLAKEILDKYNFETPSSTKIKEGRWEKDSKNPKRTHFLDASGRPFYDVIEDSEEWYWGVPLFGALPNTFPEFSAAKAYVEEEYRKYVKSLIEEKEWQTF